jgi:hypothetical protein
MLRRPEDLFALFRGHVTVPTPVTGPPPDGATSAVGITVAFAWIYFTIAVASLSQKSIASGEPARNPDTEAKSL